jgi:hypothetical protein
MKENNTLCGDDVHLSIHELISVTKPLLRFCETCFRSSLQKDVKQASKNSVKTDSDIHALLEGLNEISLYFPHILPNLRNSV